MLGMDVRPRQAEGHADRRVSVLLRMRELQDHPVPAAERLLRVLLIRDCEVPADAVSRLLLLTTQRAFRVIR
jgi:hypothetical protein